MAPSKVKKPEVLAPGVINVSPVNAAFEALTGEPWTRNWEAWRVFVGAIEAALAPTPKNATWLKAAAKPFRRTVDEKYFLLLLVTNNLGARPQPEEVRRRLASLDARFLKLTDKQINDAFHSFRPDKKRGATNLREPSVAAELCLAVKAFEHEASDAERLDKRNPARTRVAGAIRAGANRYKKTKRDDV